MSSVDNPLTSNRVSLGLVDAGPHEGAGDVGEDEEREQKEVEEEPLSDATRSGFGRVSGSRRRSGDPQGWIRATRLDAEHLASFGVSERCFTCCELGERALRRLGTFSGVYDWGVAPVPRKNRRSLEI